MECPLKWNSQFANNINKVVIANANMQDSRTDYPVTDSCLIFEQKFFDYQNDILKTI